MEELFLEQIRNRATAPTSLGYAYTHYREDVLKLLAYIEELRIVQRRDAEDAWKYRDLCK